MVDEFEDACEAEVLRRASARSLAPTPQGERSRVAWLVARLYEGGSAPQRSRLLTLLMRPLGPLALVGVASGAFAGFVGRAAATSMDDLGRFSRGQVFELARFVEQVHPQAMEALARAIAENRAGLSVFADAAAQLLARVVGIGAIGATPSAA
jgi:hypothetical protein